MEFDKFDKKLLVDIDGHIESGKQFDVELKLPEDHRNVIFGILKDRYNNKIKDAVIKLIEVERGKRTPVSHTFTNEDGEFVFGPLCPFKTYAIDIWVNRVEHVKICKECSHEGSCLKGIELHCNDEPECDCELAFEDDDS